jgi:hypothetical protein
VNDTLWRHLPLSSQPDRVSIGFELVEQRRWQGVLDLWDPWEQGATSVSDLGRLQMLLALIHLAVEESARHIGPALDALDEVLDGAIGSLVDDSSVTASVLRPAAVALAVRWADEVWGTASLAAAGGRTPGAVTDLFARAKALSPAGA